MFYLPLDFVRANAERGVGVADQETAEQHNES